MSREDPTILVVDDDRDNCRNLADILGDLGYRVDTALGGSEALALVRSRPYDVALLDLRMPGMDGLQLYREIKRIRPGTVALLVTAYSGGGAAEEALTAGMWKVLPKPIDLRKLLPLVGEAVEQPLVMVVDDDRDLCANLWDLLREHDYRVAVAHDAEEAARHLRDSPFRVVLLDMKLPNADGGELFHHIQEACPGTRTVLITGAGAELRDVIDRILAEGADAVCYKPLDVPELLGMLGRLTGPRDSGAGGSQER